jgi:Na+/alanine symporter
MLDILNDLIWSKLLIVMLIGLGLYFTIASRFVQFRYFGSMFRILGEAFERQPGQLSSFQALMLSVAGRVGAGNIAGVSVAIMLGGPGAIFWMWVVALSAWPPATSNVPWRNCTSAVKTTAPTVVARPSIFSTAWASAGWASSYRSCCW